MPRFSQPKQLRCAAALLCSVTLLHAGTAAALEAGFPPWKQLAAVAVIDIVTADEDGSVRKTPVWFVLVEGAPYLRTSDSRWLANIVRGSDIRVFIEGLEYQVGAQVMEAEGILPKVDAASLAKYGWQERALFARFAPPDILKLVPYVEPSAR